MINNLSEILKKLEAFVLKIYQSLSSILKIIILSNFNLNLPRAKERKCFILGNGPSLKESIKKYEPLFIKSDLICVNHFALSEEYHRFKPIHYVLLDPNFFPSQGQSDDQNVEATIKKLAFGTDWEMNLFVPRIARKAMGLKSIQKKNSKINVIYYNYTIVQGFNSLAFFLFKRNLGMPVCQNVIAACIFLALNMRYKKVYLFGADHSWIQDLRVSEQNELYMNHFHFYTKDQKPLVTKILKQNSREPMKLGDYLQICAKAFNGYYILNNYSKVLEARIYNSSEISLIDAFEREQPTLNHTL